MLLFIELSFSLFILYFNLFFYFYPQ